MDSMIMIKTFKHKFLTILLLLWLAINLFACGGNQVVGNQGKVIFEFPEESLQYLPYNDVPNYILEFDGMINTAIGATTSNKKFFSKNDDFFMSDILEKLFSSYQTKDRLTTRLINQEEKYETRINRLVETESGNMKQEGLILKVENGEIFNEIAYLILENGLTLSVEYRRFITIIDEEPKTIYTWRYTTPLNAVLHYPLIVHLNEKSEKELLIVPLPMKVIYHLGVTTQISISTLLKEEKYQDANFRSFYYPEYSNDPRDKDKFDREENVQIVKKYYERDFQGRMVDNDFVFSYLGYDFKVIFDDVFFRIDVLD